MNDITVSDLIAAIITSDPWVCYYQGGEYCFYCEHDYPTHEADCLYHRLASLDRNVDYGKYDHATWERFRSIIVHPTNPESVK